MIIGIDFGATQLRVGATRGGELVAVNAALLDKSKSPSSVADQISTLISPAAESDLRGIGIGVPGLVDEGSGVVYHLLNVPGWDAIPLKELLESRYGVPVSITNDSNCFALGVHRYGVAKGLSNVVGLTLGTGLGAGIIADNRLVRGNLSGFGELGLMPYRNGILENYASGMYFGRKGWPDGAGLARSAAQGDRSALALFEAFGYHLGQALRMALFAYAPEAIVLGGSVSQSFSFFESAMKVQLTDFPFPKLTDSLKILVSDNRYSSILGAAALLEG